MSKVLHINSYYITTKLYRDLLNHLHDQGVQSTTYAFYKKGNTVDYNEKDVIVAATHNTFDRINFFTKHYKTYRDACKRIKIEGEYQVLHAHSLFSNGCIAYLLRRKYKIPYIVAVRDTDVNTFYKKTPWLRWIGRLVLSNAEKVIFISEPYKKYCLDQMTRKSEKSIIENKSIVLTNGIASDYLENKTHKSRIDSIVRLIYVGRINKRKNVTTTIKACEELMAKGYKVEFTVVGQLEDASIGLDLNKDYVRYINHVERKQLIEFYRKSDIFIMPSITETFGLVYAEAMSQGLPVIYTKNQGFDGNFPEGEVGYSVGAFNTSEIVKAVENILDNYDEISTRAMIGSERFNWEDITREYAQLYSECEVVS